MPIAKLMQQKPICSANGSLRAGPPVFYKKPNDHWHSREILPALLARESSGGRETSRNFGLVAAVLHTQRRHVTPFFIQILTK